MDQILPPKPNDLEFQTLRQIKLPPTTRNIPSRIQSRLRDLGHTKDVLGGIVLTDDGLQPIEIGK
jgi:hypothetical protein